MYNAIQALPKIELHCHLDGSLRPETVKALSDLSHLSMEAVKAKMVAPANCDSLLTYIKCFDLPISVLQTEEALERCAYELMEDAALEGVKYIEIRFAPQQHKALGLTYDDIIKSVLEGIRRGEEAYEIKGNLILSYLRHTDPEQMREMIDAGLLYLNKGVVAVDLCAGEVDRFSSRFLEVIAYAESLGYRITIHAGETGIAENVMDAITLLKADRIGHGVAIMNNPEAYAMVKDRGITLEVCPTSNLDTKAFKAYSEHVIDHFYKDGLRVTVNTDNRTVSDITMVGEYEKIKENFHWASEDFIKIFEQSIEAAYADQATKAWLRSFIN